MLVISVQAHRSTELLAPPRGRPSWCRTSHWLIFFFQAEDGIRAGTVTGVQTCALPISADDVGTTLADLVIMREVTCHTAGATAAAQQALPATAFGVFEAVRAAAEVCLGRSDLEGLRVAVQGLGNVGMPLCGYLSVAGAALVVSDLDANRCAQAAATYGATVAAPEEIHTQLVDVFAPSNRVAAVRPRCSPRRPVEPGLAEPG